MKKGWALWILSGILLFGISVQGSMAAESGKYGTIVLREFSLEGAAIQENEDVKAFAQTLPPDFAEWVASYLESMKVSQRVVVDRAGKGEAHEGALVVEGKFTKITAGSTAARWVVGFGAGSSTVGAQWTVKDVATGKVLEKFIKNQHTSSSVRGIHAVESDARYLAKYVASTIQKLVK
jgi:hypothetical protein